MYQIGECQGEENPSSTQQSTIQVSGSEAVILSLLAEKVDVLFGYPGGAIMPVYDAFYSYEKELKHYLVRHEQGAVHAAQGYARVTGEVGVCIATSGPGATNLITGIADAMIDSTPIVCITGQASKHLLGTDAFQETDVIGVSMPITKWNIQVTDAQEIPEAISKAFFIAKSGRPGPVLIDITKNAQIEKLDFHYEQCTEIRSYPITKTLPKAEIKKAVQLINTAKKPLILAGQGVLLSGAQKELQTFAEKTGIPVANTLLGLSSIPQNHPSYIGYLGMHGNYGPNVKTNEADLLIAIGMRFDDRVTGDVSRYAKQAKKIHIEIDPAEINKIIQIDVAVVADAKQALKELISLVDKRNHENWISEFKKCDQLEKEKVVDKSQEKAEKGALTMTETIQLLSEMTEGKAIVATDVGQHQMVTSRYYRFNELQSNVTSGGLGTMGFCLPAAIGAKIGKPNREVVAVIGDGGYQMTIQELGVIMQYEVGVKVLILNNNYLGMVRQWQELFFEKRYSFVEMTNPNFMKIAEAYSIPHSKVTQRTDLRSGISDMLAAKGSYVLEVVVEKEENVFPMVASGESVANIRLE